MHVIVTTYTVFASLHIWLFLLTAVSITLATAAEVLIGPVKVKVYSGDITKEKTDAIVSSTNTTLNLTSGKQPNGRNVGHNMHCILPYLR